MTLETMTLGALLGYLAGSAPSPEVINNLREKKPEFYDIVDIDLSTARDNLEYTKSGTFIWIDNQFARGSVTLRLNEPTFKELDLRHQKYISAPFVRFFITNVAGQGTIRLIISRGYQFASEPIEAINLAELAARLGSPVVFDRRGDVIWMTDFSEGISSWRLYGSGTNNAQEWTSEVSHTSGFSLKLTPGSTISKSSTILKDFAYPILSSIGWEFAIALSSYITDFWTTLQIFDGTKRYFFKIAYDADTDTWSYTDSGNDPQTLSPTMDLRGSTQPSVGPKLFHIVKLVVDPTTAKYKRLIVDSITFDLSEYAGYETVIADSPRITSILQVEDSGGTKGPGYIGHVIVTQNEP